MYNKSENALNLHFCVNITSSSLNGFSPKGGPAWQPSTTTTPARRATQKKTPPPPPPPTTTTSSPGKTSAGQRWFARVAVLQRKKRFIFVIGLFKIHQSITFRGTHDTQPVSQRQILSCMSYLWSVQDSWRKLASIQILSCNACEIACTCLVRKHTRALQPFNELLISTQHTIQ